MRLGRIDKIKFSEHYFKITTIKIQPYTDLNSKLHGSICLNELIIVLFKEYSTMLCD
jgi:hypothetical protein